MCVRLRDYYAGWQSGWAHTSAQQSAARPHHISNWILLTKPRERTRERRGRRRRKKWGEKRERYNIENVRISSKYVYRKPASWVEIANIKHLLQLMFNPWFQMRWLYKPVKKKRLRQEGLYTPSVTLRKQSLVTLSWWTTMTHCLLASLDVFTICSQSCQLADIKVLWCSLLSTNSQWSWIVMMLKNKWV